MNSTLAFQITPASPILFIDEPYEDEDSGAGPSFDGAGTSFPPKTRNSLIGTIFGNRSPLSRKKLYLPTTTPNTTPIGSPRPSYDNDIISTKRRGSVASPKLGDKLKGFLNGRRGSCIESPIKSSLSLSINYDDDVESSPYFVPISPTRSPFVSSLEVYKKSEFRIFEDLEELDLENEDNMTFVSSERREYKNDISFDEALARMVEKMSIEGYSEEQINSQLQKERENNQACKDSFRPKTPTPTSWHTRAIESINRSFKFESPHHLLADESNQTPKNILDSLPTEVFSEKFAKDGPNCSICLGAYTEGELMKSLPCFHCFHTDCLDQWFKASCSCPKCKSLSI